MKMTQTTNAIHNLLIFFIFCHMLSERRLISGQAYHFSKGWTPGKRTNILLQPSQFTGTHTYHLSDLQHALLEKKNGPWGQRTDWRLWRSKTAHGWPARREQTAEEGEQNELHNEEDMIRLRTLLKTLPMIKVLAFQSSALLPSYPSSYSHTSPQCPNPSTSYNSDWNTS